MILELTLIVILQAIGVCFSVGKKCLALDKLCPHDTLTYVFNMFWREDRITVLLSGVILVFNIVIHVIIAVYVPGLYNTAVPIPASNVLSLLPNFSVPYLIIAFGFALFLGFTGQGFMYKLFGKLEKKVVDNLKLD